MKLYLISQKVNIGYDTYDSAVVAAESEQAAREINPSEFVTHVTNGKWMGTYAGGVHEGEEYDTDDDYGWVRYDQIDLISVIEIGTTYPGTEPGVILASYNAG